MRAHLVVLAAIGAVGCTSSGATTGTSSAPSTGSAIAPALDAITQADIRRDMFALGGDAMRGREAGTLDEMRATGWVAEHAREAGLSPAGDDGTFFQWWPMRRTRLSVSSQLSIGGEPLRLWKDVVLLGNQTTTVDAPIVFLADSSAIASTDLHGKAVAMELPAIATQPLDQFTIRGNFQGTISQRARARAGALAQAGAAAVILVSNGDANEELAFDATAAVSSRGSYGIDSTSTQAGATQAGAGRGGSAGAQNAGGGRGRGNAATVPTLMLRHNMLAAVKAANARLTATIFSETFYYPSGNVIGVIKGTDPRLANEYVLFSGHQDHDGARYSVNGDSIWNGADDNASVSVALLAAARAFAKHPAPRPVLFIWHGAEERGLLGSRWYVAHPTVPHSQIVAVLNADMIGRNNPDSAALLGAQPPHKNSNALVAAALRVNDELTKFKLDTIWDRPTHTEGWYFRSDHLPYARAGIPAIEFSTLLHPDYHTPRDEPARIDIPKLTKMAEWMYATGWVIATAKDRPDLIPGFRLER
jgi:Zn-dependent M28 family amino/carboxypeptidase